MTAVEPAGEAVLTLPEQRALAAELLSDELNTRAGRALVSGGQMLSAGEERRVRETVLDALFGPAGLQRLLEDEQIEGIDTNGCDDVWVQYADGRKERAAPIAGSDTELIEQLRCLAARASDQVRRLDRGAPRLDLVLPDGSRLLVVMGQTGRVSVSLRRHHTPKASLDGLQQAGTFEEPVAQLLRALVLARKNVIVTGDTKVGKTTLLRALAAEIPATERLITVENTFELGLVGDGLHRGVVALQAHEAKGKSTSAASQAELVRWALQMAPDRVIVGEIRGAEVVPMCDAMTQGGSGSLSTLCASTPRAAFTKLAAYAIQSPERLSLEATNQMVASAVHFVVHLAWDGTSCSTVSSVREVVDADGPRLLSNEILRPGPDRRPVAMASLRADTAEELADVGFDPEVLDGCGRGRSS
ncbi:ATPase, T2SS/T4P/T4SS family [Streptomyces sp. NPDC050315]|uniref:CpaF family protein n=1 Tax=Streptomyces sp. NPDC050315 TaxID=3155039 RepID=UPI00341ECBEE